MPVRVRQEIQALLRRRRVSAVQDRERFDLVYLVLSGTTTAARCPEVLHGLLGPWLHHRCRCRHPMPRAPSRRASWPTCPACRWSSRYFDLAIRPRPPRGVVLFAPCSFNSLNKLAHGIADNLALSVVAEAIGRRTPVIVAPSLNQPLLDHPQAQVSLRTLPTWGVTTRAAVGYRRGTAPGADSTTAGRSASVRAARLSKAGPGAGRPGLSKRTRGTRENLEISPSRCGRGLGGGDGAMCPATDATEQSQAKSP